MRRLVLFEFCVHVAAVARAVSKLWQDFLPCPYDSALESLLLLLPAELYLCSPEAWVAVAAAAVVTPPKQSETN